MEGMEITANTQPCSKQEHSHSLGNPIINIMFGPFLQRRKLEPSNVHQLYRPRAYYQSFGMGCLEGGFLLSAVGFLHLLWHNFLRDRLQDPAHSFSDCFSVWSRQHCNWTLEPFSLASFCFWSSSFRIASQPSDQDQVYFPPGILRSYPSSECLLWSICTLIFLARISALNLLVYNNAKSTLGNTLPVSPW